MPFRADAPTQPAEAANHKQRPPLESLDAQIPAQTRNRVFLRMIMHYVLCRTEKMLGDSVLRNYIQLASAAKACR